MFDWDKLANRLFGRGGPQVRLMDARDLDEVLRMIRLHDSDDYKAARASFSQTRFDAPQEVTAHFVIIEPEERRPVGVTGYYIDDLEARGLYWLGWTYVNPFFRGKGYGGVLMEFVLEAVRELRGRKIYLSTSSLENYASAVGFYKRYGFVEEGRLLDYYNDGEHQLIMGRRLDQPIERRSTSYKKSPKPREEAPAGRQEAPPLRKDSYAPGTTQGEESGSRDSGRGDKKDRGDVVFDF